MRVHCPANALSRMWVPQMRSDIADTCPAVFSVGSSTRPVLNLKLTGTLGLVPSFYRPTYRRVSLSATTDEMRHP